MRRILITGGAGNIGASMARRLVMNSDNFVTIVDNLITGSTSKLPDKKYQNWKFIKADVNSFNDIAPIIISGGFDFIFHYAALVGVQRTLSNPKMVLNDIDGIRNVLDLAKNTGVMRIFYSSSSEVYGEALEFPQFETTTPLNSRLPYAIVKNISEAFCRSYQQEYGLDYTIFRFFNTYGPLQSEDFVISKFIARALLGENIEIYGDGDQTRTFCYIDDNLDVTESSMMDGHCINDVMNVGSDIEITILDLARMVIEIAGSQSSIVHLPPLKEGDMTRRQPDINKMLTVLQRDILPLELGLRYTTDFFRKTLML